VKECERGRMSVKDVAKWFKKGDHSILKLIHHDMNCQIFDRVMPILTFFGGLLFSCILPIALIVIDKNNSKLVGFELIMTLVLSTIVVQVLKKIVGRIRPFNQFDDINNLHSELNDYSFPSGHTTAGFAIAMTLMLNIPGMKILLVIALGIAVSRIYLGVHFPTDVLFGAIIGWYTASVVHIMFWNDVIGYFR
jgi:undecaprenyl-diphosphatase